MADRVARANRPSAFARGKGARAKGSGNAQPKPPLKQRARAFAFEGLPEKDRFGIFDPGLRGSYIFGLMLAGVFVMGGVFDAWGRVPVAFGVAGVFAVLLVGGGYLGYRRIWPTPAEREIMLRMAREEDEARALRAKLTRARARAGEAGGAAPNPPSQAPEVDRSADEPGKAF